MAFLFSVCQNVAESKTEGNFMKTDNPQAIRPHPPHWTEDSLSDFMERTHQNSLSTFVNFKPSFSRLQKISEAFDKAIEHLNNVTIKERFFVFFILRAHSTYLAGTRFSTSGQVCEAFIILRGCLEAALYGYYFYRNPEKVEIWLRRHDDAKSKKAVRKEFLIGKMLEILEKEVPKVGKLMRELYETCIDYGAHPNERSMTSNMRRVNEEKAVRTDLIYVDAGGMPTKMCMKTNAQVGICVLRTFNEIFSTRFKIVLLDKEIKKLSRGL